MKWKEMALCGHGQQVMGIKHQQKVKEGQLVKMRERIRKGIGNKTNQK